MRYWNNEKAICYSGFRQDQSPRTGICPTYAEVEEDFILENGSDFSLVQTPVTGGEPRPLTIHMDGLPERPDRTTRVRVLLSMPAADRLRVQVTDMGFGEIFPSGGGVWEETFAV